MNHSSDTINKLNSNLKSILNNEMNMYNQHYELFCRNINTALQKELGLQFSNNDHQYLNIDWKPPATYGLNNSARVIPEHYFDSNGQFKEIDMFYELMKDIRNLKPLTSLQLEYVKTLPKEKIIELLDIYNLCLKNVNEILERL
jgi:hypothetical protein